VPLTATLYSWGADYATSSSFNFENLNTLSASAYDLQSDRRGQEESWDLSSRAGPEKLLFS
jgi:hypothetical protein